MRFAAFATTLLGTLLASTAAFATPRSFECAENGHQCRLLETEIEGSRRIYETEYTVHTKFDCRPGNALSNVIVYAGPESRYRPYYDGDATVSLVGYALRLTDEKPDLSFASTFYGKCGLEVTYEAAPSAGQKAIWAQQADLYGTSLANRTETVSYGPQLLFWQAKVTENPTTFYPYVTNLYNLWKSSASLTQRVRANLLKQVLDQVPRATIEAGLTAEADGLRALVAEAETFQSTVAAASGSRDADLDSAIAAAERALPAAPAP